MTEQSRRLKWMSAIALGLALVAAALKAYSDSRRGRSSWPEWGLLTLLVVMGTYNLVDAKKRWPLAARYYGPILVVAALVILIGMIRSL